LCVLLEAKALGAKVIGAEVVEYRINLARELGADAIVNPLEIKPGDAVAEITHGRGADIAIETSGSPTARSQIVDTLGVFGKAAIVGLGPETKAINPGDLIETEKVIMGSHVMPMGMYRPFAELLVNRKVGLERIVTHRFSIDRGVEALEAADSRESGKVVIEFV
jgi:propanol-preferring alcohol dehydrogenase